MRPIWRAPFVASTAVHASHAIHSNSTGSICCGFVCKTCRQQIEQVEFEPHHTRMCEKPAAVGLCNNVLPISTDAVAW